MGGRKEKAKPLAETVWYRRELLQTYKIQIITL